MSGCACENGCAATDEAREGASVRCGRAWQPRSQLGGSLLGVPADSGSDEEGLWRSYDLQRCRFSASAPRTVD